MIPSVGRSLRRASRRRSTKDENVKIRYVLAVSCYVTIPRLAIVLRKYIMSTYVCNVLVVVERWQIHQIAHVELK